MLCAHLLHTFVAEHRGGTDSTMKRAQPHPPHTRGTFHRRLQPLYTEKHKVSCSGFLPNTSPMQHSCSHYMRFAAAPTHPCNHDNAICIHTLQNTKGEPIRPRNDRSRTRRTQEVPFIASCSHCTRKNRRFRAPASSPKQSPCNIHAAITMRFATFPSSPLPFVTTSLSHHFPKSAHPLRHHFP